MYVVLSENSMYCYLCILLLTFVFAKPMQQITCICYAYQKQTEKTESNMYFRVFYFGGHNRLLPVTAQNKITLTNYII